MHEVSLVEALFDQLDALRAKAAGHPPAAAVRAVRVRIGAASGVEPMLFETAYDTCRGPRGYGPAALELAVEPAAWRCPMCGAARAADAAPDAALTCSHCQSELALVGGEGIFLDRVELEVPDV